MTPFERAEKNIKKLAENLSFTGLIQATVEETEDLSKEDSDLIVDYFDKFNVFLSKNSLKIFTKDIIELKF